MKDTTQAMLNFSLFLNQCWEIAEWFLKRNTSTNFDYDDWLQANWEILVETKICEPNQFLQFYGEGGNCYDEFSRITYYQKLPTHKIICELTEASTFDFYNNKEVKKLDSYTFNSFLNISNTVAYYKPPFDYVELEHDELEDKLWLHKNHLRFLLKGI